MRKLVLFFAVAALALLVVGIAIAIGVHSADAINGATVTIDGETFSGAILAGSVGCAVALGVALVGLFVVGVLASVAIFVPIVLVAVAVIVLFALVMGLAPILVPVLLLVGAYVLLSRWTRRRSAADAGRLPSPSPPPSPTIS